MSTQARGIRTIVEQPNQINSAATEQVFALRNSTNARIIEPREVGPAAACDNDDSRAGAGA